MTPGHWVTHRHHDQSLDGVDCLFSEEPHNADKSLNTVGNHCPSILLVQLNRLSAYSQRIWLLVSL